MFVDIKHSFTFRIDYRYLFFKKLKETDFFSNFIILLTTQIILNVRIVSTKLILNKTFFNNLDINHGQKC